jgi:hypothetical protein
VLRWADNNLLDLKWEEIGEHYGRYRLHVPEAERAMARVAGTLCTVVASGGVPPFRSGTN